MLYGCIEDKHSESENWYCINDSLGLWRADMKASCYFQKFNNNVLTLEVDKCLLSVSNIWHTLKM